MSSSALFAGIVLAAMPQSSFATERLTLYHSAPGCAGSSIADRNTADALGDLYFLMKGMSAPLECKPLPNFPHKATCGNYSCNSPEESAQDLYISKVEVDVEAVALHKAQSDLTTYAHCDESPNCSYNCSSSQGVTSPPAFGSWNLSLLIHQLDSECYSLNKSALVYDWWESNLVSKLISTGNGYWYSTLKSGEGSTWKNQKLIKRIAKNCSDGIHYSAIEHAGQKCFASSGKCKTGKQRVVSAPCWINCYYATVLGPRANASYDTTGGMSVSALQHIWDRGFEECPAA